MFPINEYFPVVMCTPYFYYVGIFPKVYNKLQVEVSIQTVLILIPMNRNRKYWKIDIFVVQLNTNKVRFDHSVKFMTCMHNSISKLNLKNLVVGMLGSWCLIFFVVALTRRPKGNLFFRFIYLIRIHIPREITEGGKINKNRVQFT